MGSQGQAIGSAAPRPLVSASFNASNSAQHWLWAALFGGLFAGFCTLQPSFGTAAAIALALSGALIVAALAKLALAARDAGNMPEAGIATQLLASGLFASLLWCAISLSAVALPAGTHSVARIASAFGFFALLVVAESVASFAALRLIGATKSVLAAELAFVMLIETKFGGLFGRIAR